MQQDVRETISSNGSFYEIVKNLYDNKQAAAVLYESDGVTRGNGIITDLFERQGFTWMQLNGTLDIRLDTLYAVNGTFSSDYSEC